MGLVKFEDLKIERIFLAGCLKGPSFWKDIPEKWLKDPLHQRAYKEFRKFLKPPYSTYPTHSLVLEKTTDQEVQLLLTELESVEVTPSEINVRVRDLFDMFCSRQVYEMTLKLPEELERIKIEDLIRDKICLLSELTNPLNAGSSSRGFIYDTAVKRWLHFKDVEAGITKDTAIPFGIQDLDRYTKGGLRKSHILLIVAPTGTYKSQTMGNIAYNYSFLSRQDTMVMTLEIPGSGDQEDYQRLIDSRHSLLEFSDIVSGNLGVNRPVYREKLMDIANQKYPLYIVDLPDKATPADIIKEFELYYAKTGKYPEALVVDYANEMEPVSQDYNNSSGKFKNLGVEFRRIARSYGTRIVTAMQLNREGKKIKNGEKRDLEHVSESQYFANVCHLVLFLHQDSEGIDAATNQLHCTIRKNRYGQNNVFFSVFANPAFFYVGDKKVLYPGFEQ